MGSSIQISEQLTSYRQKKRENHQIFGEIITIQSSHEQKFYTIKQITMQNIIYEKQFEQLKSSSSLQQNYYISIKKLHINKNLFNTCSNQQKNYIIFDCIEINLQNIENSEYFSQFSQNSIVNIIWCILQGLITLQSKKLSVFPICKKSVILATFHDQYRPQDLSQAVFKVIPINLIKQQPIKIITSPFLFPPQIQNSVSSIAKSALMLQFTPKNHIYCIGMMILDMIYNTYSKQQQISFGQHNKTYNKQTQIKVLQNSGISSQLIEMIKQMIQQNEQKRINLTQLYENCKILQQKNNSKLTINTQNFNKIFQKQQILTSKLNFKTNQQQYYQKSNLPLKQNKQFLHFLHSIQSSNISSQHILSDLTNILTFNNINKNSSIIPYKQSKNNQKCRSSIKCKKLPQRLYFDNGAFYQGELNKYGEFHGFGTLYYTDSQICYTGYWHQNNFHGFGYLFSNYFSTYKQQQNAELPPINYRDFSEGDQEKGHILWKHYEGEFKKDKKDGFGILFFVDGSKFEGNFTNNKCNGTGIFTKADGTHINGFWKNNKLIKQHN